MARDREPWVKLKIGTRRSGKLAELPSDSARLGYIWTLTEAKVQRSPGTFDSRRHFDETLGRFAKYLDDYIAAGLAHEAPRICDDCKPRHPGIRRGAIVIHDFAKEQRDPTNADRQAAYRGRLEPDPPAPDSNADRNGLDRDNVTPTVTATVTAHSRARGTTATTTTRERADSKKAEQDVTRRDARAASESGATDEDEAWIAALSSRGGD